MSDFSELKKLAEGAHGNGYTEEGAFAFRVGGPRLALELIAEVDRLKTLRSTTERDLAQELEVWRNGPACWSCGDTGDVHDIIGEWRGKCDCIAAQLIEASSERDQLRAELERLRTAEGDAMTYKAGMENCAAQRDELKAENKTLRYFLDRARGHLKIAGYANTVADIDNALDTGK